MYSGFILSPLFPSSFLPFLSRRALSLSRTQSSRHTSIFERQLNRWRRRKLNRRPVSIFSAPNDKTSWRRPPATDSGRIVRPRWFSPTDFRLIPAPSSSPHPSFFLHPSVRSVEGERALRDPYEKATFCRDAEAAASSYGSGLLKNGHGSVFFRPLRYLPPSFVEDDFVSPWCFFACSCSPSRSF